MIATIGTVLTPQMKEQTIYVSDDGEQFDNAEDCQLWERLAEKVEVVNKFIRWGVQTEEDDDAQGFPPLAGQNFLDIRLHEENAGRTLAQDLFEDRKAVVFLETAKDLKAFSDWLWS